MNISNLAARATRRILAAIIEIGIIILDAARKLHGKALDWCVRTAEAKADAAYARYDQDRGMIKALEQRAASDLETYNERLSEASATSRAAAAEKADLGID